MRFFSLAPHSNSCYFYIEDIENEEKVVKKKENAKMMTFLTNENVFLFRTQKYALVWGRVKRWENIENYRAKIIV